MTLLDVKDLHVTFTNAEPVVHAVNGISFTLQPGEAVAIVGESGCGKSVTALTLLGFEPKDGVRGSIEFMLRSIRGLPADEWRSLRGSEIAMIFQDPGTALNPAMRVDRQIAETMQAHDPALSRAKARAEAHKLLDHVGIEVEHFRKYPHEMSGGQRQRVMIAVAISCRPKLLIADEPTTALDVTTQAQIVELVKQISAETAVLWITHDLALASTLVSRVLVMYAGRIVEEAPVSRLFTHPAHPYTQGLLRAIPGLNSVRGRALHPIPGSPPVLNAPPTGCSFYDRCTLSDERCLAGVPEPERQAAGHYVACVNAAAAASAYRADTAGDGGAA